MRVTLEVYGQREIDREIVGLETRGMDLSPAFDALADYWIGLEKALFASAGASGGKPWKPLSPKYLARKIAAGKDPRILIADDDLRPSLSEKGDPAMILHVTRDSLTFGSTVKHGAYHARGNPRLPRRKPVQLTEGQKRESVKRVQRYVVTGTVGPGAIL